MIKWDRENQRLWREKRTGQETVAGLHQRRPGGNGNNAGRCSGQRGGS